MSVQSNQYLILGVKLPFPKGRSDEAVEKEEPYWDSAFEGIKHHKGLCVVSDGMNGGYQIIGRVLLKSANYENLADEPIEFTAPDRVLVETVAALIETQFGIENPKVGLWFVTHYR